MTILGQSTRRRPAGTTAAGTTDSAAIDAAAPTIAYVPALDGLRGLAVAAVVAFHVGHLKGGYLGVDLFFVLSGFLITSLLLAEAHGTGRVALVRFWERRARRLLPALAVMLVIVAAYARFAAYPSELHRIRGDGIATMLYVANWREVFRQVGYWMLFVSPSPLNHTWSLAIEEQFYLLWPLLFVALVVVLRRRSRSTTALATGVGVLCAVLAAASLAATLWIGRNDSWDRVYYGTDTRAFALLVGAALAAVRARSSAVSTGRARRTLETGGLIAFAALMIAWVRLGEESWVLRHGGLAACSVAGALVIAAASHARRGPLAKALAWTPLRWLGLISYGVYLYHWPVIVWLDAKATGLSGASLIALQIVVTLTIAIASYHLVEQPIRHSRTWPRLTTIAVPTIGFAVVISLLGVSTIGYLPLESPRVPSGSPPRPAADGPPIMVIGDSVADFVTKEGIIYLRSNPQPDVVNQTIQGCSEPPTDVIRYRSGETSRAFTRHCDGGWDAQARRFDPDYVVYMTVGVSDGEVRAGGEWLHPCSDGYRDLVAARIEDLAERFAGVGATLAVVTAVPEDPRSRDELAYRRYLDANACWNAAVRHAAASARRPVVLIDLADQFCTDRECRLDTPDGSAEREDGAHYRGRAAQIIGKEILAKLKIEAELPG